MEPARKNLAGKRQRPLLHGDALSACISNERLSRQRPTGRQKAPETRRSLATAGAVSESGAAGTAAASARGSGIACYPNGRRRERLRVARWTHVHHAKCRRRPGFDGEPKVPGVQFENTFPRLTIIEIARISNQRKSAEIAPLCIYFLRVLSLNKCRICTFLRL